MIATDSLRVTDQARFGSPFDSSQLENALGIYRYLNDYAAVIQAPVRQGVTVNALRQQATGFLAETRDGPVVARSVVVATGPFQKPLMPRLLPETPGILQLHAAAYKAPESLPGGAVLVVGTGASGAQTADDLMRAGRQVCLSVSRHRRTPRRYRGDDHVWWWRETGLDRTPVDQRPTVSLPVIHNLPVFETDGQPKHRLGVTDVPGLYFLGLNWLSKLSSSFLFGVGDNTERLAGHIAGRA